MTKAQNSFLKAIPDILQEIEFNATSEARAELLRLLSDVSTKTIWGIAIHKILFDNSQKKIDELIAQLSQQAAEDTLIMSKIVGWDATIILLKIYGESLLKYVQTDCGNVAVNSK